MDTTEEIGDDERVDTGVSTVPSHTREDDLDREGFHCYWLQLIIRQITQDARPQLLTLHRRSVSGQGRERVAIIFAYKGSQYFEYA